jgi:hypothetical protein
LFATIGNVITDDPVASEIDNAKPGKNQLGRTPYDK